MTAESARVGGGGASHLDPLLAIGLGVGRLNSRGAREARGLRIQVLESLCGDGVAAERLQNSIAFVPTPSAPLASLGCSAPVAAPVASTGPALGLRGPASGRHLDAPVRPPQGRVSQAESTPCASPRASRCVRSAHSAPRAQLPQTRWDCRPTGLRGCRRDPPETCGLARVSGSPVCGAPLGCQPEPVRAPKPGYPLKSHTRRGPSPPSPLQARNHRDHAGFAGAAPRDREPPYRCGGRGM